jgi:hypothetical protein
VIPTFYFKAPQNLYFGFKIPSGYPDEAIGAPRVKIKTKIKERVTPHPLL